MRSGGGKSGSKETEQQQKNYYCYYIYHRNLDTRKRHIPYTRSKMLISCVFYIFVLIAPCMTAVVVCDISTQVRAGSNECVCCMCACQLSDSHGERLYLEKVKNTK